jgi:DNA-binding protein H-NS
MASNLITARSLIQADLDHARRVLGLWTHQVEELEKALEQIDAVSNSRTALRVQYQGSEARSPALEAPASTEGKRGRKRKNANGAAHAKPAASANGITSKRGRKLAERSTLSQAQTSEAKGGKSGKVRAAKQGKRGRAAKYKDPNSDKTWSGLGRRPAWFVGQPEQYAINAAGRSTANGAHSDEGAGQGDGEATPT